MPRFNAVFFFLTILMGVSACKSVSPETSEEIHPLTHEAYLWQGAWTGAVKASVTSPPTSLVGLRVLLLEYRPDATTVWPDVDLASLIASDKEVTAVVRIGGSRPIDDFSLDGVIDRIEIWKKAGLRIVGIEIDHDCATARLPSYIDWIERLRPSLDGLRLSITALPTWMESPDLQQLTMAVDEIVLQVHAILAPRLFDASQAMTWITNYSEAYGQRPFRVALPTYRIVIDGKRLGAHAEELQRLVSRLSLSRFDGLLGVVWFRLPVIGDTMAFSAATLTAVIEGDVLASEVKAFLRPVEPELYDIVVENGGTLPGRLPPFSLQGQIETQDLAANYKHNQGVWHAAAPALRPGETRIVGWVRGKDINIESH